MKGGDLLAEMEKLRAELEAGHANNDADDAQGPELTAVQVTRLYLLQDFPRWRYQADTGSVPTIKVKDYLDGGLLPNYPLRTFRPK